MLAISSSTVDDHRGLAAKIGASFPILADPDGKTIRAYGLLHENALPFTNTPVARPAEILLDGGGVIRDRFLTENWRVRERAERLLEALGRIR